MRDILTKVAKKGDVLKFYIDGKELEGTVLETTCVHFEREYRIKFQDGSERWFVGNIFQKTATN